MYVTLVIMCLLCEPGELFSTCEKKDFSPKQMMCELVLSYGMIIGFVCRRNPTGGAPRFSFSFLRFMGICLYKAVGISQLYVAEKSNYACIAKGVCYSTDILRGCIFGIRSF